MSHAKTVNCSSFSRYDNIELCSYFGRKVILKHCKVKSEFEHEKKIYDVIEKGGAVKGVSRKLTSYGKTLVLEYIAAKEVPKQKSAKSAATEKLIKTVQRMHEKGVAHKDLRFGDNIIFDGDRFVIIDFDAACLKGDVCNNKAGMHYASYLFGDHETLPWDQWVFLDYLNLADELSVVFRNTLIGKRFQNLRLNAMDLVPAKKSDEVLNANELLAALHGDTWLTKAQKKKKKLRFPKQKVLTKLNQKQLLNIMLSYEKLWRGLFSELDAFPSNLSMDDIKKRIVFMSNEEAKLVYDGDTSEEDFIQEWNRLIGTYNNPSRT